METVSEYSGAVRESYIYIYMEQIYRTYVISFTDRYNFIICVVLFIDNKLFRKKIVHQIKQIFSKVILKVNIQQIIKKLSEKILT